MEDLRVLSISYPSPRLLDDDDATHLKCDYYYNLLLLPPSSSSDISIDNDVSMRR
jgi:hypothetical protein